MFINGENRRAQRNAVVKGVRAFQIPQCGGRFQTSGCFDVLIIQR